MSREIDAEVAEKVFGHTGIGYYGPPESGLWSHDRSRRFDTPEQAIEAYRTYWETMHKDKPTGFMNPDENEPEPCYWEDGWGPIAIHEYTIDPSADYEVLKHVRENWGGDGNEEHWPKLSAFEEALEKIQEERPIWASLAYEPGDYAKAALEVVKTK